ncbi:MAG: hypothetical protein AB7F23_06050 [Phycisphaerae bacterium]
MKKTLTGCLLFAFAFFAGCGQVSVTRTSNKSFVPTFSENVDILMLPPNRAVDDFIELATVVTSNWGTNDSVSMHKSLRKKAALLGADAVILISSGIDSKGKYWTSGVAIRYK